MQVTIQKHAFILVSGIIIFCTGIPVYRFLYIGDLWFTSKSPDSKYAINVYLVNRISTSSVRIEFVNSAGRRLFIYDDGVEREPFAAEVVWPRKADRGLIYFCTSRNDDLDFSYDFLRRRPKSLTADEKTLISKSIARRFNIPQKFDTEALDTQCDGISTLKANEFRNRFKHEIDSDKLLRNP